MTAAPDLTVELLGLRLKNPILAASGTFAYGVEFADLVDLNQLGGIVVKSLSLAPTEGAPPPRLVETRAGMLNAIGLQNIGARRFVTEKLPLLRNYSTVVIASVFGSTVEEYAEVVRVLEDAPGVAAYELNVSSPNAKRGGMHFGRDAGMTAEVTRAVKQVSRRPVIVKLSPNVTDITEIARAAVDAGADALTIANTFLAMAIDLGTRRPRLGNLTGGLSGPAIKPIVMRMVYETQRAVRVPIIASGGVADAADVVEYLIAGATAVQVGTATFADPRAPQRIVRELETFCRERRIAQLRSLIASVQI